jgi:hypothetical protein
MELSRFYHGQFVPISCDGSSNLAVNLFLVVDHARTVVQSLSTAGGFGIIQWQVPVECVPSLWLALPRVVMPEEAR